VCRSEQNFRKKNNEERAQIRKTRDVLRILTRRLIRWREGKEEEEY
jgi:hypothetical protein